MLGLLLPRPTSVAKLSVMLLCPSPREDPIIIGTTFSTMKDVVKERRNLNPTASICYFNLIDKPDKGIGAFDLEARPLVISNRPTQTSA